MNFDYSFHGVDLVQTCGGCPEQYNAFKDGVYIGYLRLRHGCFTVEYELGGYDPKLLWTAQPEGDGVFCAEEREHYLDTACYMLAHEYKMWGKK